MRQKLSREGEVLGDRCVRIYLKTAASVSTEEDVNINDTKRTDKTSNGITWRTRRNGG